MDETNAAERSCRWEDGYMECRDSMGEKVCVWRRTSFKCRQGIILECLDNEIMLGDSTYHTSTCVLRHHATFNKRFVLCNEREFRCKTSGRCIPKSWVMDREDDCSSEFVMDRSDEEQGEDCGERCDEWARCGREKHLCRADKRCIERHYVNDGFADCSTGEDERVLDHACRDDVEFSCGGGGGEWRRCIPRRWVSNKVADCSDGRDEVVKLKCRAPDEFACGNGERCVPDEWVCDGVKNCRDGSDEICDPPTMVTCRKGEEEGASSGDIFPWSLLMTDRLDRNLLERFCTRGYQLRGRASLRKGFKCLTLSEDLDSGTVGPLSLASLSQPTKRRRVVPQWYIAHNVSVCYNHEDVCYDHHGAFNCSRCLDGAVISPAQLCDGIVDCADLSDECMCQESAAEALCSVVYGPVATFVVESDKICDGEEKEKVGGVDERFCDDEVLDFSQPSSSTADDQPRSRVICVTLDGAVVDESMVCDGKVDCGDKEDECSTECFVKRYKGTNRYLPIFGNNEELSVFISTCFDFGIVEGNRFSFNWTLEANGAKAISRNDSDPFNCKTQVYFFVPLDYPRAGHTLTALHKCPRGSTDSLTHSDLSFVCEYEGVACPWLHVCAGDQNLKIAKNRVCDLVEDCSDGSDELHCHDTHFYCRGRRPPYIPISKKRDGRSDCQDRSDECVETEFSSVEQMIKSAPLRYYTWVSGIGIVTSNAVVISKHVVRMRAIKSRRSAAFANTFSLANLALSDAIFGLTLLSIGVKSALYSGAYCESDLAWRSGVQCEMIGVLTVVSSQTSMNLLVLMTALRLYVTYKPFMTNSLNPRALYSCILLCWIMSLLIALCPLIMSSTFVHSIYTDPNPFFNDHIVSLPDLMAYINKSEKMLALNNRHHHHVRSGSEGLKRLETWYFATRAGVNDFPDRQVTVKGSFGYYSSSSVCFPNFYSQERATSSYSLAIIVYNCTCLLFITLGYLLISRMAGTSSHHLTNDIRRSTRNTPDQSHHNRMMRRIFYIIVTDVLCWLPIIIMSLMSYNGFQLPEIAHTLSTIVFLPINSFLNPIIYSRSEKPLIVKLISPLHIFNNALRLLRLTSSSKIISSPT